MYINSMEWKPGWVGAMGGEVQVHAGQRWDFKKDGNALSVTVAGRLPSGEVVLRPKDPAVLDLLYPAQTFTTDKRGTPLKEPAVERLGCPFFWVDDKRARSEADKIRKLTEQLKAAKEPSKIKMLETSLAETFPYVVGDLLAHEAWDVWSMIDSTSAGA